MTGGLPNCCCHHIKPNDDSATEDESPGTHRTLHNISHQLIASVIKPPDVPSITMRAFDLRREEFRGMPEDNQWSHWKANDAV